MVRLLGLNDLTQFEALTGGAFDRLKWQHSGEYDQNFSIKSNAPGVCAGQKGMGGFGIDRYKIEQFSKGFSLKQIRVARPEEVCDDAACYRSLKSKRKYYLLFEFVQQVCFSF